MFPRKHPPRRIEYTSNHGAACTEIEDVSRREKSQKVANGTHRPAHTPPTLIRGCVNVATLPVLRLEGAEIHLPIPGAISLFGDSLVCR